MWETISNAFKIPELKKRILFTFGMLAIYRLGAYIPTPGVDPSSLDQLMGGGGVFGILNMFSGGALKRFSIFALGIAPYINASIIMQLLIYVVPALERIAKEDDGRKKITQYTRYGTIVIGAIQALGMSFMLRNYKVLTPDMAENFQYFAIISVLTLTAGTSLIMWIGELITERGIGNGISLLIFAGIIAAFPNALVGLYRQLNTDPAAIPKAIILAVLAVLVIAAIVFMQEGTRKIPVQYAKRVVGRKIYGGQSTHIPLRINQAGVIPVIFASSILLFPGMIIGMIQKNFNLTGMARSIVEKINSLLTYGSPFYILVYTLLIIFFAYFYTAITFNPKDISDNMKKYGGFIPGIRPGKWTTEFIEHVLVRITLAGAVFLAGISILPIFLIKWMHVPFYFGGTGLLIVVGVGIDTMKQIESHMLTRHYEGFMKKNKILKM